MQFRLCPQEMYGFRYVYLHGNYKFHKFHKFHKNNSNIVVAITGKN
jgi:hypothetical protein